jgi:type II secretory ATPase GspE/PulE/Tfp pilus assembly ATPase PilB-like protein
MKMLCNLKPAERRARQTGFFQAAPEPKVKYTCRLTTQGTAQGEVALLQLEGKKTNFKVLEDAGMRQKTQEDLMTLFDQKSGILLFCSPPQGGLSVLYDTFLEMTDRYLRNFVCVEDVQKRERGVENVQLTTYDSKAGEGLMTVLPKVARTYPDVMVVREPGTQEVIDFLLDQPSDNRYVVFGIRAKEAVEAPVRVLMLKTNHTNLANSLMGVVNVRLVRRLCEQCREAYAPPPELLKQMGIPAGKLEALYRPPTPVEGRKQEICTRCNGIGYYGRAGIYELLSITDDMRKVLVSWPKLQPPRVLQLLRDAQRATKQRTLQEEGLLLVARGITSVQELIRCLKG